MPQLNTTGQFYPSFIARSPLYSESDKRCIEETVGRLLSVQTSATRLACFSERSSQARPRRSWPLLHWHLTPKNPFNPINSVDPGNPANPINRYNPNNPFNPINEVNPQNPLNPINKTNPNTPFKPLNRPSGADR